MKPKLLNVREHLKHLQLVIEGYQKYGKCPAIDEAMTRLSFMNRAILKKHEASRVAGNRKDLRVGV